MTKIKKANLISCIIFLLLIFAITIFSLLSPVKAFSENENRLLANKPGFTWNKLFYGEYTSDYETFITDQFVWRDSFIGLKTLTEIAMQKKEINGIYLGKGDYLIETFSSTDVDQDQLSKNESRLIEFASKYSKLLSPERVHIMLVPTASEVLRDKLPAFAEVFNQSEFVERLQNSMNQGVFINLLETLKSHSKDYIYYRTDHHWTSYGAYLAYQQWAGASGFTPFDESEFDKEKVTDSFRGTIYSKLNMDIVSPDEIYLYKNDLNYSVEYNMDGILKDSLYELDFLEVKDKYSMFLGENNALVQINTENTNGRKLLIFKDSYANCFTPFAVNHYETTFMVDFRYFNMPISQFIQNYGVTDILVLYNVKTFMSDINIYKLAR